MPQLNAWSAYPGAEYVEHPSARADALELWAYTDALSYAPGQTVHVHVHSTAPRCDVRVARDAAAAFVLFERTNVPVSPQTTRDRPQEHGCGWNVAFEIPIPPHTPSGVYVFELNARVAERSITANHFIVVRAAEEASNAMALVLSTSTYCAYNDWGGGNYYRSTRNGKASDRGEPLLSFERPWSRGFAALPAGAPRHGDGPDLPRHAPPRYPWIEYAVAHGLTRHYVDSGWAYYDRSFALWAERAGFEFDYLTQHDLHFRPELLDRYSTLAIVGHDEYWTWEMRDAVDAFVDRGGAIARFGGNFFWQVRLESGGTQQASYRAPQFDPLADTTPSRVTTHWDWEGIGRPAAATLGLTGLGGVYSRFGAATPRSSGGLTVYRPDHWAFEGTDLYYGDQLGAKPASIASFEVDGCDYTFRDGLPFPTHIDATPDTLEIIAMTPAVKWEEKRYEPPLNAPQTDMQWLFDHVPTFYPTPGGGRGAGMIAAFTRGRGEVFNAGCSEWVSGLVVGDEDVERVTANVLRRFLGRRQR